MGSRLASATIPYEPLIFLPPLPGCVTIPYMGDVAPMPTKDPVPRFAPPPAGGRFFGLSMKIEHAMTGHITL